MAEGGPRATRPRPPTSLCRLQGGGEVHQPLDLDALAGAHVADVVEIAGGGDQFGPAIRVPGTQKNSSFMRIGRSMSRTPIQGTE